MILWNLINANAEYYFVFCIILRWNMSWTWGFFISLVKSVCSVSRSGVRSSAAGGLDGDDRTERAYESTTQPCKDFPAKAAEPQRAHNEQRDVTGNASQESTYSGTVRARSSTSLWQSQKQHIYMILNACGANKTLKINQNLLFHIWTNSSHVISQLFHMEQI